jgi:hypothetical protein
MAWIREQCRAHHGPLASVGVLELQSSGLRFQPQGSLDKLVGLPPVELSLADIDAVRLEGIDRMLHVDSGGQTWRFAGPGARRVGRVLSRVLASEAVHPVLVSAGAQLVDRGAVDVFVKADRIALVDASAPLDSPWERLARDAPVRTQGLPSRLHVGAGAKVWTFSGQGVHKLAALLLLPSGGDHAPVIIEGSHQSGLLAHAGLIALGCGGMSFAPSGLLDQLIGQTPEVWPWHELRSLELRSGGVVFGMEDGPVVLSSHDADALWSVALSAVDAWMERRAARGEAWTAAQERGAVDRPKDRAPGLLTGDREHELLTVNLELYTRQVALALPGSPRGMRIDREDIKLTHDGQLQVGDQRLLLPRSVRNAWGIGVAADDPDTAPRFARLVDSSGRVLLTADSVHIDELIGMTCVALPGRPPRELVPGLPLRIELSGGVSNTRTGVVVSLLAPEEDQPGWRLLLASGPNASATARPRPLADSLDATIARLGADGRIVGKAMPAELIALARGGCELRMPQEIPRGALLRLVLTLDSGAQRLSGRVEAAQRKSGRHHATITFLELEESILHAIDAVVVSSDFGKLGRR